MFDANEFLNAARNRIVADAAIQQLVGSSRVMVVKGPRKPDKHPNPVFTVGVLSAPLHEDGKFIQQGTIQIKFYYDNHASGNANIEVIGPVMARLARIFDDQVIHVPGWCNYALWAQEVLAPLPEARDAAQKEHHGLLTLKFGAIPEP